jgi:hypothetical protein
MPIKVDFTFDNATYRHFMNGHPSVLHCHHYVSLTTKLAEDLADSNGPRVLRETAEDSIRPLFDDYFAKNAVTAPADRLRVGEDYYAVMGMGRIAVSGSDKAGEVRLVRSHVDEGWIKKWGSHTKPINHFTCGYVAALFAATFGRPARSFMVTETASLVTGAPEGRLMVRPA